MALEIIRRSGFEILYDPAIRGGAEVRNSYDPCMVALDNAKTSHGRHGLQQDTIDSLREELNARRKEYERTQKT